MHMYLCTQCKPLSMQVEFAAAIHTASFLCVRFCLFICWRFKMRKKMLYIKKKYENEKKNQKFGMFAFVQRIVCTLTLSIQLKQRIMLMLILKERRLLTMTMTMTTLPTIYSSFRFVFCFLSSS